MNWPRKWGFAGDLRECKGRTIADVELAEMEFGSISNHCWLVLFTDGSRAFLIDRPTSQLSVGPSRKSLESSRIVEPSEIAEYAAAAHQARQKKEREE